ncbi:MAG: NUDIX domain-containing protein, partial [Cycloclasticus sp.]
MIKDAAALILLRDSDNGMEVCMLRRVETSGFAAGAYVFPGGAVDAYDKQLGETEFCLAKEETDSLLQANKVAAIRETLEEAGILASTNQNGIQIDDLLRHK